MKVIRLTCVLLAAMPLSFAASKEIIELQRDVSALSDQVKQLNDALVRLTQMVQDMRQGQTQSNTALEVMRTNLADTTKRVQDSVSAPLLGVSSKIDTMGEDFRNLRETVNDLGSRIGKLDAKVTDLQNTVNVIRTGPVAPPGAPGGSTPGSQPGAPLGGGLPPTSSGPATPPAGMQAETLYSNAYRDYLGANYDLALQEFSDYVKYFNETQFAPNSQFYIGNIYYKKQDYPNALQAFDAVLEHYTDNPKTAGAHYWKGMTLLAMGKRDAAAKEFREILNKYSSSDVAPQARTELRKLGLSASPGAASRRSRRSR